MSDIESTPGTSAPPQNDTNGPNGSDTAGPSGSGTKGKGKLTRPRDGKSSKKSKNPEGKETAELNYRQALEQLQVAKSHVSKRDRRKAEKEYQLYLSENPQSSASGSETSASTRSSGESEDSDTSVMNDRKKKVYKKFNKTSTKRRGKLPKLLNNYETALKNIGGKIIDETDPNDANLLTIINAFSKRGVEEALEQERKLNRGRFLPKCPMATPPNLKRNPPPSSKNFRDALQTLRDIQRALVDGTGDGLVDYLNAVARTAIASRLDKSSFYDLLKSRIAADSTLYKEVSRHQKAQTSLTSLYKSLSISYQPESGYLGHLRRYQTFNGSGLTASQFLTKLKSICHDLVASSNTETPSESHIYQLTRDKVYLTLPSIAPLIIERLALYYGDNESDDEMSAFTDIFMSLKDRITLALTKVPRKNINQIDGTEINFLESPQAAVGQDSDNDEIILNQLKKLSQADLTRFANKCFKCADTSPIQKESHKAKDCLLYKGDPLAYYICNRCHSGIHLPKICKGIPENKHLLVEKIKQLGLPLPAPEKNEQSKN